MKSVPEFLKKPEIAEFCRRNGIKRLALFGSVLRGEDKLGSDVDLLVEFLPGVRVGLFGIAGMELELSNLIGRKVDLRTAGDLSRYFRDDVVRASRELYAA